MNDTDAQLTKREKPSWRLLEQVVGFMIATGAFAILGPFGTYDLPPLLRVGYWGLALGSGWVAVNLGLVILRRIPRFLRQSPTRRITVALIAAIVPTVLAVRSIEALMRPDGSEPDLWLLFFDVIVVSVLLSGTFWAYFHRHPVGHLRKPETEDVVGPKKQNVSTKFLQRLPPQFGRDLVSLSAQDHYVEVTTELGTSLLHMRLSDALKELEDYPGQRIHRSHWISANAFYKLARDDHRLVVHLKDGRILPVSRSHTAKVREWSRLLQVC